ncbi:tRNA-modifying protein YgfZ [Candidatus Steffania adelgidicola]|uniref:tRNA-modifying protein YgfZ n=1 Tax=Candidatus Steffania adelgidicola TaxID=1076626 RepID=UPI001D00CAD5|nr:tRNA-modifying protein YgfZ [Candidatus Steffania adelgidicola]UDG80150.1 tRNA-modifying protein YgfZ [Candidatus Steffania adelgidicola]
MSSSIIFPSRFPLPSIYLPLTLISQEDWGLVRLNGAESMKYLQGQLTCDVASLDPEHFSFGAHCDAKGKMLSYLCVFYHGDGVAFIERRSVRNSQIAELKKYAVFSRTNIIADDETVMLGVAGFQARRVLARFFSRVPDEIHPVSHNQETTLLYFNLPRPRFLLITTRSVCISLQDQLIGQAQFNDSRQWLALDIEAGYPVIDSVNAAQFIPQAANLQMLNAISFNKGCYAGQEMVARAKYHGVNTRGLYWLAGKASYLPTVGDKLELKIGDHWRQTGTVLAACNLEDATVWIQAVLKKNLKPNSLLRVKEDQSSVLSLRPLQYVID